MQFNKSLVVFCCLALMELAAQAQDTTTTTSLPEVSSEYELISSTPTPRFRPTNRFLRFLYNPIRTSVNSTRQFISGRLENVRNGLEKARLQSFKIFMSVYNKTYSAQEIPRRMALYFKRREAIQESVKAFREGKSTYVLRENTFTDWDENELKSLTNIMMPSAEQLKAEELKYGITNLNRLKIQDLDGEDPNITVSAEIMTSSNDWKHTGCVREPIRQERCGSCYAISIMSVVESMLCIKGLSPPLDLSPQQIVDCAPPKFSFNGGCSGGWPTGAFEYLREVGVAARSDCYPYADRKQMCMLSLIQANQGCVVGLPGRPFQFKILRGESEVLNYVANKGPVVTVMMCLDAFFSYDRGILDDPKCVGLPSYNGHPFINHALVITGFGTEQGIDYWIVKNSWGKYWGEEGYLRVRRNRNTCNIASYAWGVIF